VAGQPAARRHAPAPHNDIKDWMRQRNAEVRTGHAAEAAGRSAWAHSTRTGGHLQAHHPDDVRALGKQVASYQPSKGGPHESIITTTGHAIERFQKGPPMPHPPLLVSAIPVVGPAWDLAADIQQKRYGHAAIDVGVGLLDASFAKAAVKGAGKVLAGKAFYRPVKVLKDPYNWKERVRPWMGEKGHLKEGQHGHHGLIPQNGWGKAVPNKIKNQPWNIKPMPDAATHMKIHGLFGHPKFNPLERYWHGTPGWWKKANGSVAGHAVTAEEAHRSRHK
jgi:hypothetical protein